MWPMSNVTTGSAQKVTPTQPTVMREGQLFHGKIVKLHPNQMAEVQIGKEKMLARLELPMKAGDAHYFQVKSTSPELQLRVVSGPLESKMPMAQRIEALATALKLPVTKEMSAVLRHFIQHEIPATREQFIKAEQLLQRVPKQQLPQALRVLQQMVTQKLPMTNEVFQSLQTLTKNEPVSQLLQTLQQAIQRDPSIQMQMKQNVLEQLSAIRQPLQQTMQRASVAQLFQQLIRTDTPQQAATVLQQVFQSLGQQSLAQAVGQLASPGSSAQSTLSNTMSPKVANFMQQLAQTPIQPSPMTATEARDVQKVSQVIQQLSSNKGEALRQLASLTQVQSLSNETKQAIRTIVQQTNQNPTFQTEQLKAEVMQQLTLRAVDQTNQNPTARPTIEQLLTTMRLGQQMPIVSLQQMEQSIPQEVRGLEQQLMQKLDGEVVKQALQQVVRHLGFNFEHQLAQLNHSKATVMDALKPQLLALLQDTSISKAVRDGAESMLLRMNAPVLSATEQGAQQQFMMQVPLELFGKKLDTTLHWEGQMTDDGEINPDFARVLFYLNLEALNETVVDMQVQNKIVTITIFNDTPNVQKLGVAFEQKLKEGLQAQEYRLSGIFFKPIEAQYERPKKRVTVEKVSKWKQGVDFRV